jgi:hypothetical protein
VCHPRASVLADILFTAFPAAVFSLQASQPLPISYLHFHHLTGAWEPLQQQHMRLFNARMVGKMQWADTHVGSQEDMKFWKGKFILTLRSHCAAANRRKSSANDDKAVTNKSEWMSEIARLPYEESGRLLRPGCLEAALVGVTSRSAPLHTLTPCSLRPVLISHLLSLQT